MSFLSARSLPHGEVCILVVLDEALFWLWCCDPRCQNVTLEALAAVWKKEKDKPFFLVEYDQIHSYTQNASADSEVQAGSDISLSHHGEHIREERTHRSATRPA